MLHFSVASLYNTVFSIASGILQNREGFLLLYHIFENADRSVARKTRLRDANPSGQGSDTTDRHTRSARKRL